MPFKIRVFLVVRKCLTNRVVHAIIYAIRSTFIFEAYQKVRGATRDMAQPASILVLIGLLGITLYVHFCSALINGWNL